MASLVNEISLGRQPRRNQGGDAVFDGGPDGIGKEATPPLYWGSWGDLLMITNKMGQDWGSIGADFFPNSLNT